MNTLSERREHEIRHRQAVRDMQSARRLGSLTIGFGSDRPSVILSYRGNREWRLLASDFSLVDVKAAEVRTKLMTLYSLEVLTYPSMEVS